jgi:hypothetical protein
MRFLFLLLMCLSFGCSTFKDPKTKFVIPDHIKNRAFGEINSSKGCIESKGISVSDKNLKYVQVYLQKGEKKFTHGWGWRSPEWNGMWVLGLCIKASEGKYIVKVGYNPNNPHDVSDIALKHEFGHLWLMHNFNDWSHNKMFSNCFVNWQNPAVRTSSVKINGLDAIICYINDEDLKIGDK